MNKKQVIKKKITKNGELLSDRFGNNNVFTIKKSNDGKYIAKEKNTIKPNKIEKTVKKNIDMDYNRYKERKLGIIIVNLNNLLYTKNLLNDFKGQTNNSFHIHLYDQNSDEEGTAEFLDELNGCEYINIIKNDDNIPLNHLWNTFVKETNYEYLCFLNNDINITNNFVDDTIKALDSDNNIGIVIHPTNNLNINKSNNDFELIILDSPPLYQGWDFSFKRDAFEYIPSEMLIFGGDDFIFSNVLKKGYRIGMTMSSPIIHYKEKTRVKISNIREIQNNDAKHYWNEVKNRGLTHVNSTMATKLSNKFPPPNMKLEQNNKCIYTALIGDYDNLYESNVGKKEGWDYICFSDNKDLKSEFWRVIYVENNNTDSLSNYKLARYFKTNFHQHLSSYEYIIWKDARCIINTDLDDYLLNLGDNDMVFSDHVLRKNILQEMDAVLSGKLETNKVVDRIKKLYASNDYKYDNGLMSSGLILFKNNSNVIDFFRDWWEQIRIYSYRDQLSLNYVLSKHDKIKYKILSFHKVFGRYFKQGKRKSARLTF